MGLREAFESYQEAMMKWLSVKEAAEELGISTRSAYEAIERGSLRAVVRRGYVRGYRVSESELKRYMKEEWEPVKA